MRNDHKRRIEKCGAKNQERPMWVRSKTHKRLVGSSVAKTVAPNNRLIAGAFGPGFPAKGRTASANIAYVQMKAILIVKAE
jgi:ribosomal protein L39E